MKTTITCPECGYTWTDHTKLPPVFCSLSCSYRSGLRDRANVMLDGLRKQEALEFTYAYLESLTPRQ